MHEHEHDPTQPVVELNDSVSELLVCPACKRKLRFSDGGLKCVSESCGECFPLVDGIPILINERASLFSIDDFRMGRNTTWDLSESALKRFARRVVPDIGTNVKGAGNNKKFAELLRTRTGTQLVLMIGAGESGTGAALGSNDASIEMIATDVSFGTHVKIICDAHDIPFDDGSLDAVIVHAVLEHVVDPCRCVAEIHRVLKPDGLVYADTPFMQQVHGRQYDFERFTFLGHRRLFRHFEEIDSGASCGPGMALAWAYYYFFLSFTSSKFLRRMIWAFCSMTSFYLKYFDHLLIDKPAALDAASGYYFIGRRSDETLTDRELIKLYKGAI